MAGTAQSSGKVAAATIRPFCRETDESQLVELVQELQQHELKLYSRMKPPSEIGRSYVDNLCKECQEHHGRILVAVDCEEAASSNLVGYACVLTRVQSENKDEIPYTYGEVTDLAVSEQARGKGIGRALLTACEDLVRENSDVKYLRTSVLARNSGALAAYQKYGFEEHLVEMEKRLE
eukprot:CAMPEP_0194050434 /NCGR_PEP_ID=MMETSP0009_2-20130614/35327_1 /TAXON_ID=210454 /ORGANISM="Grammatophora oceanica, Strain CCMP 410" /LENGTH=177 /DNA_ID=CAMNT_0038697069 /DNA_START=108 /DNA_END=641 /DNA_ORIENTATION=+